MTKALLLLLIVIGSLSACSDSTPTVEGAATCLAKYPADEAEACSDVVLPVLARGEARSLVEATGGFKCEGEPASGTCMQLKEVAVRAFETVGQRARAKGY